MIQSAFVSSVVLAICGLGAAYGLGGVWVPAAGVLILGVIWLAGSRWDWPWLAWVMMGVCTVAAAVGAWLDLRPLYLVIGLIAALSAWDLDHFWRELRHSDHTERKRALTWRHLRRLWIVDGIGLLCSAVALQVRIELSFGVAIVLGLLALVGLSRTIGLLGRETGS